MTFTDKKNEQLYSSLEQGLTYLREMAAAEPAMAAAVRLLEVGQRLEAQGEFGSNDVCDVVNLLLQDRAPNTALDFLARVEARKPRTLLHRAVVTEITRRSRVGCG